MGDALLPFPLTERSVHLCVDMQRIFSADGPWPAPWMEKVLPSSPLWRVVIPGEPSSLASSRLCVRIRCQACGSAITRAGGRRPANSSTWICWG